MKRVTYIINDKPTTANVLMTLENGDVRTDKDGIRTLRDISDFNRMNPRNAINKPCWSWVRAIRKADSFFFKVEGTKEDKQLMIFGVYGEKVYPIKGIKYTGSLPASLAQKIALPF